MNQSALHCMFESVIRIGDFSMENKISTTGYLGLSLGLYYANNSHY